MRFTGYKIVQESDEIKDDPQQLFVIDYNSKDFGQVLQGNNNCNRVSLITNVLLFVQIKIMI